MKLSLPVRLVCECIFGFAIAAFLLYIMVVSKPVAFVYEGF